MANQYYPNPEDYFEQINKSKGNTTKTGGSDEYNEQTATVTTRQQESEEDYSQSQRKDEVTNYSEKTAVSDEYIQIGQISDESQEIPAYNIKNEATGQEESRQLFNSAEMNNLLCSPIVSIEDFFSNPSWPLPEHDLEHSPCYPIIDIDKFETMGTYYRCKIHRKAWSPDLIGIEHHCKYDDPDLHKSEVLRSTSKTHMTVSSGEEAA